MHSIGRVNVPGPIRTYRVTFKRRPRQRIAEYVDITCIRPAGAVLAVCQRYGISPDRITELARIKRSQ